MNGQHDNTGPGDRGCWCGGDVVDVGDEFVCGSCGTVLGCQTETPTSPNTQLDFGLPTTIPNTNKDYAGRRFVAASTAERLRTCNQRTQNDNRTLPAAMAQIARLRDILGMTEAAGEYAAYTYRKAVASGLVAGRAVGGSVNLAGHGDAR